MVYDFIMNEIDLIKEKMFLQALAHHATDAMREMRIPDILNTVCRVMVICLLLLLS